jgi:3-oxoacyl-[acyl-carrier protein] reductase
MTGFSSDFVLLITGGTGPIGSEIALQAAQAGAKVVVHGRSPESCATAVARLQARLPQGRFAAAPADYLAPGAYATLIDDVVREHGGIDAVVNCAMSVPDGISGLFHETDPEQFAELCRQAVVGFQLLCHAALPHLQRRNGAIVAISSDAGRFAAARQALIGSARSAITGFVRNLAVEIARDGVRINSVSLTWVADTPIFERFATGNGRAETARKKAGLGIPKPSDIAPLVLLLCSRDAAKITGQEISINGGLHA